MSKKHIAFKNKNTGEFCTGGFLLNHGWDKEWIKLYEHPKEWQGLSDEEVNGACKNSDKGFNVSAFRQGVNWAEQKLKEKNT